LKLVVLSHANAGVWVASGAILAAGRKSARLRPALSFLDYASLALCKNPARECGRDSVPEKCVGYGNALGLNVQPQNKKAAAELPHSIEFPRDILPFSDVLAKSGGFAEWVLAE
jgi:hypothetical protein